MTEVVLIIHNIKPIRKKKNLILYFMYKWVPALSRHIIFEYLTQLSQP